MPARAAPLRRSPGARVLSLATIVIVMHKAEFLPLQLPPSVSVPSGAVDHSSGPGSVCSRSLHTSPLKHQVVWLLETKLIVDAELGAESADVQYISACLEAAAASQRSVCATVYELSHCM